MSIGGMGPAYRDSSDRPRRGSLGAAARLLGDLIMKGATVPAPDNHRDRNTEWNRDDEQKPGSPPRTAYEPKGSEGSTRTAKTLTDPASGEPNSQPPTPNRSDVDRKIGP
jgi:hypothetical protein